MGVSQPIRKYRSHRRRLQPLSPLPGHSLAAIAGRCLDIALQIWDQDQAQARSQIKVAAAILHANTDELPIGQRPPGPVGQGLVPWQIRKVQGFIEASLDSKIRLRDCAGQTRLSASHFSRAFKATFGVTVLHYIHRRRVERAQQLMLTSEQTMAQIALSCGFADQAHYCRVFRAVVGLSPNRWRRQIVLVARNDPDGSDGHVASGLPGGRGLVPALTPDVRDHDSGRPITRNLEA